MEMGEVNFLEENASVPAVCFPAAIAAGCDLTMPAEGEELSEAVTVTNTGCRAGKAVVQLYVAPEKVEVIRPVRELKDFVKVELAPGESKTVSFWLGKRAFSHWDPTVHQWCIETGKYTIQIVRESGVCFHGTHLIQRENAAQP